MGKEDAKQDARDGNHKQRILTMIDLTAERINLHSPYVVSKIDDNYLMIVNVLETDSSLAGLWSMVIVRNIPCFMKAFPSMTLHIMEAY